MLASHIGQRLLWVTAGIMAGFAAPVVVGAVAAARTGSPPRRILAKYLTWFLIIPPIVLPLAFSGGLFQGVVLLLSLQCVREFARATGLSRDRPAAAACYVLTAAVYVCVLAGWDGAHRAAPAWVVAALLLLPIVRGRYERMVHNVSLSILAVLYFGWFLSHLAMLRGLRGGAAWAFYLIVLAASGDAFGYLWGKWLGRRKLSPRISPNKTVEGAVLAAASVVLAGYVLGRQLPGVEEVPALLLAALVAVLGPCGDLVVSVIKRDVGVKDMGRALPAHGGVLDRCDSLILTAPAFFHVVRRLTGA